MSLSLKWLQNLLPSFNDLTDKTSTLTLKQTQCDHKMEQKPETVFPYLGTFKSFIVHLYKNGLKFWLIVQKSPSLVKVEQVFCPSAGPGAINLSAKRRYCHQTIGHCNCTVMTPRANRWCVDQPTLFALQSSRRRRQWGQYSLIQSQTWIDPPMLLPLRKFGNQAPFAESETRPNWARKVREMILFSVLCTVYCGRGCVSLESERGKELA